MDCGDDRLAVFGRQLLESHEAGMCLAKQVHRRIGIVESLEPADIGTGKEVVLLCRADDQRFDLVIVLNMFDDAEEIGG